MQTKMRWLQLLIALLLVVIGCKIVIPEPDDKHVLSKRNVLLIVAHPDDESMFFSPTISHLISGGHKLHVLCLSTGNADGAGKTRRAELYRACAVHKIPPQQVKILDHPLLQDGFTQAWDRDVLASAIEGEVSTHNLTVIVSFDAAGVSGHPNHRDVHRGVRSLLQNASSSRTTSAEAWELVTVGILRKYSGPLDVWFWLSSLLRDSCFRGTWCHVVNKAPTMTFRAMAQHSSQWVWFRKLFVSFSSYTYMNTLRKLA